MNNEKRLSENVLSTLIIIILKLICLFLGYYVIIPLYLFTFDYWESIDETYKQKSDLRRDFEHIFRNNILCIVSIFI